MKLNDTWVSDMRTRLAPEIVADPMMAELAEEYLVELADIVDTIKTCSEQGNIDTIRDSSHKLKGSAGTFGLCDIGLKAGELECACKRGESIETIRILVAQLRLVAKL